MTWRDAVAVLSERGLVRSAEAGAQEADVTGVAFDSRHTTRGQVFVALKGKHEDGVKFAQDALTRGASGVVSEQPMPQGAAGAWITVTDARLALALLADRFYRHPSQELQVVGITGTNGKTTTAYLVASIFDAAGTPCGRHAQGKGRRTYSRRSHPGRRYRAPAEREA